MDGNQVKIVNNSPYALPKYATVGSSGMDLYAHIQEPIQLHSLERVLIPTGIKIALPANYEAQIRPRSGLALKQGITCLNSPGTIDADYRGEIKVLLVNLSTEVQTIEPGSRMAQMVLQKVEKIHWLEVENLDETNRGAGGFGHSGTM